MASPFLTQVQCLLLETRALTLLRSVNLGLDLGSISPDWREGLRKECASLSSLHVRDGNACSQVCLHGWG